MQILIPHTVLLSVQEVVTVEGRTVEKHRPEAEDLICLVLTWCVRIRRKHNKLDNAHSFCFTSNLDIFVTVLLLFGVLLSCFST